MKELTLPELDMNTLNNACALLEEVMCNGNNIPSTLEGWFAGEKGILGRTIRDLKVLIEDLENGY